LGWINDIVFGLIETYGTNNIYELLDLLNIDIVKLDNRNALLQNNEAFYYRDYFGKEIIFIINNLSINYEKFVLSHELAHAVLHTTLTVAAFNNDLINKGKLERQANYFALKLNSISFDEIYFREMTLEQIASCLELPYEPLKQLVNI
jgi:Zn-dependent peptidase ImmA (M78 family)